MLFNFSNLYAHWEWHFCYINEGHLNACIIFFNDAEWTKLQCRLNYSCEKSRPWKNKSCKFFNNYFIRGEPTYMRHRSSCRKVLMARHIWNNIFLFLLWYVRCDALRHWWCRPVLYIYIYISFGMLEYINFTIGTWP